MANTDRDWNARYKQGELPWDSGLVSRELKRVLDEAHIAPCRALELGCGTGTNAIELARRGFDVSAVDCAQRALEIAQQKAIDAGVTVNWIKADVQNFGAGQMNFDFCFRSRLLPLLPAGRSGRLPGDAPKRDAARIADALPDRPHRRVGRSGHPARVRAGTRTGTRPVVRL